MTAVENLEAAFAQAIAAQPQQQAFAHLAATLRRAGVRANTWWLPSLQALYDTDLGPVLTQQTPLVQGVCEVAPFDENALITALRADQAGQTTFPQFAEAAWRAGVLRWDVDLESRTCTYFGFGGESYVENYPAVELPR